MTISGCVFQSFDVEADGNYIYVGLLNASSFPYIIVLPAALDTAPATTYNPGTGTEVEVRCAKRTSNTVWAAGDFGADSLVRYSTINYWYWYNDPESAAWTPPSRGLFIGPADDDMVLVSNSFDDKLYQSYFVADTGPYWVDLSFDYNLPYDVNAITRLDLNPDEIMIGAGVSSDAYWYPYFTYIDYSPNEGYEFLDITNNISSLTFAVTDLIYG